MKKTLILIFMLIVSECSFAQWTAIDSGNINAIWLRQPNDGWSFSKEFKHWDGLTWTTVLQDSLFFAESCAFPSPNDGWVFGAQDSVYRYNGSVWTKQYLGYTGGTYCDFFDSNNGWTLTQFGPTQRYQNGIWTSYPISMPSYMSLCFFNSISASGQNTAWALGLAEYNNPNKDSSYIFKFVSGQWLIDTAIGNVYLKTICFTDQTHGWAGGYDLTSQSSIIYKFDGNGWHLDYANSIPLVYGVYNIYMLNNQKGWFSDDTYNIYGYNGATWDYYSPIPFIIKQFSFADSLNGWALGVYTGHPNAGLKNNYIWSTTSGGLGQGELSEQSSEISIFPNPTSSSITITQVRENTLKCSIYNMRGELILQKELNTTQENIDLSFLSSGLYIINVTGTKVSMQKKVIIE